MEKEKAIEILKQEGFEILNKEEKEVLINNSIQERVTKIVKEREFEIKLGIENDIKNLVGIEKNHSEKTHDFLKRAFTETLEKTKTNVNKNVEEVQTSFLKKEQDLMNEINEYKIKIDSIKKESLIEKEFAKLDLDESIDKELIDLKFEKIKQSLINKIKIENDKIYLIKDDGEFERDVNNNMNITTLDNKIKSEFQKFLKKDTSVSGLGKKPIENSNKNNSDVENFVLSKSPTSDTDILKYVEQFFLQKGEKPRSAEAIKSFSDISKRLKF